MKNIIIIVKFFSQKMYKCIKCNKEFKYESQFSRHKNRKNPCNKKKEYNCNVCNVQFKCPYDKLRHEKTKKHILKVSIQGNKNQIDKSGIDVQTNKYQIIINFLHNLFYTLNQKWNLRKYMILVPI